MRRFRAYLSLFLSFTLLTQGVSISEGFREKPQPSTVHVSPAFGQQALISSLLSNHRIDLYLEHIRDYWTLLKSSRWADETGSLGPDGFKKGPIRLAIELGGGHLHVAILNKWGQVVHANTVRKTPDIVTANDVFHFMLRGIYSTLGGNEHTTPLRPADIQEIQIALPGVILEQLGTFEQHRILYAERLNLSQTHLRHKIQQTVSSWAGHQVRTWIVNDVRAAAAAEYTNFRRPFIYINLGTGIDAAYASRDQIISLHLGLRQTGADRLENRYGVIRKTADPQERAVLLAMALAEPLGQLVQALNETHIILGGGNAEHTPALVNELHQRLSQAGIYVDFVSPRFTAEQRTVRGLKAMGARIRQHRENSSQRYGPLQTVQTRLNSLSQSVWDVSGKQLKNFASYRDPWVDALSKLENDFFLALLSMSQLSPQQQTQLRLNLWQIDQLVDQIRELLKPSPEDAATVVALDELYDRVHGLLSVLSHPQPHAPDFISRVRAVLNRHMNLLGLFFFACLTVPIGVPWVAMSMTTPFDGIFGPLHDYVKKHPIEHQHAWADLRAWWIVHREGLRQSMQNPTLKLKDVAVLISDSHSFFTIEEVWRRSDALDFILDHAPIFSAWLAKSLPQTDFSLYETDRPSWVRELIEKLPQEMSERHAPEELRVIIEELLASSVGVKQVNLWEHTGKHEPTVRPAPPSHATTDRLSPADRRLLEHLWTAVGTRYRRPQTRMEREFISSFIFISAVAEALEAVLKRRNTARLSPDEQILADWIENIIAEDSILKRQLNTPKKRDRILRLAYLRAASLREQDRTELHHFIVDLERAPMPAGLAFQIQRMGHQLQSFSRRFQRTLKRWGVHKLIPLLLVSLISLEATPRSLPASHFLENAA